MYSDVTSVVGIQKSLIYATYTKASLKMVTILTTSDISSLFFLRHTPLRLNLCHQILDSLCVNRNLRRYLITSLHTSLSKLLFNHMSLLTPLFLTLFLGKCYLCLLNYVATDVATCVSILFVHIYTHMINYSVKS